MARRRWLVRVLTGAAIVLGSLTATPVVNAHPAAGPPAVTAQRATPQPAEIKPSAPGSFTSLPSATRILDTRIGLGAPKARVPAVGFLAVQITGKGGVPAANVSAVVVNLTVVGPAAGGFLSAYADGGAKPTVSNLNFTKGQTIPNLAVVPVGANGRIRLFNGSSGTVDVLADVAGYYLGGTAVAPGAFRPITPTRLLDTRFDAGRHPVGPAGSLTVQMLGRATIPKSGVSAVVVNLTVVSPSAGGYVTAYADGTVRPNVSNIDFAPGQTIPNLAVVPVGSGGKIRIFNGSVGAVNLLVDVAGYYLAGTPTAAGMFVPVTPERVIDTRLLSESEIPPDMSTIESVAPSKQLPANGVASIVINMAVVSPRGFGYLTVYPNGTPRPTASNLNFAAEQTIANLVVTPIGSDGNIWLYNGSAKLTNVIGDVAGYFVKALAPSTLTWRQGPNPDPVHGHPQALSCVSSTFCVAVDVSGAALTYTGSGWSAPVNVVGQNSPMRGVSCVSTTFCMGIDFGGNARKFDGTTWSPPTSIDDPWSELMSISCVSASFCMAVDARGMALAFHGTTWSAAGQIDQPSFGSTVSCTSATACVEVSTQGRASVFNGTTWSEPVVMDVDSDTRYLQSLSCAGTLCVAADDGGYVIAYDAITNTWAAPVHVQTTGYNENVSCSSASFCVLVNSAGQARTSTDGVAWSAPSSIITPTEPLNVTYISCAPSFCGALDQEGHAAMYNGTSWTPDPIYADPTNSVSAVSCASASFCAAIDGAGDAMTYDGSRWSVPVPVDSPDSAPFSLSCVSDTFCMAVGVGGKALRYNGSGWNSVPIDDPANQLTSVSCSSSTFCMAVDNAGKTTRFDGTTWTPPAPAGSWITFSAVSCVSPTFCMATGTAGDVMQYNGTAWGAYDRLVWLQLTGVSCKSTTFCVAVGHGGSALQYNGATWTLPTTISFGSDQELSLSCASITLCVAGSSVVIEFNGSDWSHFIDLDPSYGRVVPACAATTCIAFSDQNEFFKGTV